MIKLQPLAEKNLKTPIHELIYEEMYRLNGGNYYDIRCLKFYIDCPESLYEDYLNKIITYAKSLQDENLKIEYIDVQKPKIHEGKVFSYINTEMNEH